MQLGDFRHGRAMRDGRYGTFRKIVLLPALVAGFLTAGLGGAHAALMFEFEAESTGDILATMTLEPDTGPFNHTNMTAFAFTAAGSALFGLPEGPPPVPFTGTFNGTFDVAPDGGLRASGGSAIYVRTNATNFAGSSAPDAMELQFFPNDREGITLDQDYTNNNIRQIISVRGGWVPADVPAPATLGLFGLGALLLGAARRR